MNAIRKVLAILAAVLFVVAAASCGKGDSAALGGVYMDEISAPPSMRAAEEPMENAKGIVSPMTAADMPGAPAPSPTPEVAGRKLVYTAQMSLEAEDPAAAEAVVLAAVKKAGGYAAVRNVDEYSTYLELRVPVAFLEPVMDELAGTGRTLSRSLSAQDVTDQFFDLEGRLRNKRILEERYRDYLKKAEKVSDMLDVEARLSETTNEIEWLEGSFRDLSRRIELATLTVQIRPVRAEDPSRPGLGRLLADFFRGAGEVFQGIVVVLVGIVVYGVPAVLAAAAFWWLAFGKLGLVRRLFALVRAPRKDKP